MSTPEKGFSPLGEGLELCGHIVNAEGDLCEAKSTSKTYTRGPLCEEHADLPYYRGSSWYVEPEGVTS